ncbi:MAG: hypothetical protein KDK37_15645 [Leptospiraceae bacterium]|nr:hypothetical protein [Leptospiraceae bacterium]MCB1305721.1 hypothetical protein [Leptospiraceae bacterium]
MPAQFGLAPSAETLQFVAEDAMTSLQDWYHVRFDDNEVHLKTDPPDREGWEQSFTWDSIVRICFENGDWLSSDTIYVFTSERPESYVIPTEADGGSAFWGEIIGRKLFDAELAIEMATQSEGFACWPPEDDNPKD